MVDVIRIVKTQKEVINVVALMAMLYCQTQEHVEVTGITHVSKTLYTQIYSHRTDIQSIWDKIYVITNVNS